MSNHMSHNLNGAMNFKLQTPGSKLQISSKHEVPILPCQNRLWSDARSCRLRLAAARQSFLGPGAWCFSGSSNLVFGAFSIVLLALGSATSYGGPFGMADTNFIRPQFKLTEYPGRVISDGKGGLLWTFVNGSSLEGANGRRIGGIIRTLESGFVDTNFQAGALFPQTWATAVQPDGKILLSAAKAGDFNTNGVPNYRIYRLFPNGAWDNTYSSPVFDNLIRVMTLQSDGKLIVGGWSDYNRVGNGGLINTVRLNADGSPDTNFTAAVVTGGAFQTIFAPPVIDSSNRILLGGNFTTVNGAGYPCMVRLLSNGVVDPSFTPSGFTVFNNTMVRGFVVQSDGRIVVSGGRFRVPSGGATNYGLIRLNTNGLLDSSFTLVREETAGFTSPARMYLLRQTTDGKFLVTGNNLARFNSDGSLDNSFTRLGFWDNYNQIPAACAWFELLSDGKMIVPLPGFPVQADTNAVNGAFRLNSDGTLDSSFNSPVFQSEAFPPDYLTLPGGQMLVWGYFDTVGNTSRPGLARFNSGGTLDSSYNFNAFADLQFVSAAGSAPDSSLYAIVGRGTDPIFDVAQSVQHILPGGQLDTNFQASLAIPTFYISGVIVQNGKPIIWWNTEQDVVDGDFPDYRLNADGSLDPTYLGITNAVGIVQRSDAGLITNVTVGDAGLLTTYPSGKLLSLISSDLHWYDLLRLNADGTVDTNFNAPRFPGYTPVTGHPLITDPVGGQFYQVTALYPGKRPVLAAQVLGDGSVLIAGAFRQIADQNIAGLAKLQPNGALDPTFPGGPGAALSANPSRAARVDSITSDSSGRIWITGNFDHFNGVPVKGLARLNSNGSVDASLVSQASYYDYGLADSRASNLALNADGSVLLLGTYRLASDAWPYGLTRLMDYGPPTLTPMGYLPNSGFWLYLNLVEGQSYRLQGSADLRAWSNLMALTGASSPLLVADPAAETLPRRFYRVASP